MSEYQMKPPKQAEAMTEAYHKVEDAVVGGYKAIEKKYVDAFLEKPEGKENSGDVSDGEKE